MKAKLLLLLSIAAFLSVAQDNTLEFKYVNLYDIEIYDNYAYVVGSITIPGNMKITDGYVAKIQLPEMNLVWEKYLGGNLTDKFYSLTITDSIIYIVGEKWTDIKENKQSQIWLTAIDHNGNLVWEKTIGNKLLDAGFDIIATSDMLYIAGYSKLNINTKRDLAFIAVNPTNQKVEFSKYFGTPTEQEQGYLLKTVENQILIVATVAQKTIKPWILSLDHNGYIKWEANFDYLADDYKITDAALIDNSITLIGSSWAQKDYIEIFIAKFDLNGKQLDFNFYNVPHIQQTANLIKINSEYYIFGYSQVYNNAVLVKLNNLSDVKPLGSISSPVKATILGGNLYIISIVVSKAYLHKVAL